MPTYSKTFSGRPYDLQLVFELHETDTANNRSRYTATARVKSNSGWGSYITVPVSVIVTINGVSTTVTRSSLDFRPDSTGKILSFTPFISGWIEHDSEGFKTFNVRIRSTGNWGVLGTADTGNQAFVAARIPKPPTAPGQPSLGTITTTSVALSWTPPADDRGAEVTSYQVQRATNAAFTTGVATSTVTGASALIGGLASGTSYWFKVTALNSAGSSPASSVRATATKAAAPTALNATDTTPTSFTLGFTKPSGNAITKYEIQQSLSASFTSPTSWEQTGTTRAISDLTPATAYFYRVRPYTAGGWGAWSATFTFTPQLPAPALTSVTTETTDWKLRAAWSAPSITTGLTGYRIQTATDAAFTQDLQHNDIGNVLTADVTRTGGRRYWVRVAARTAGGVNTYSAASAVIHRLPAGNVDAWTRVGTKPAPIEYYTENGIRRGTAGVNTALILETLSTGTVTIPADAHGMQRTITGLTPDAAYRFEASATLQSGAIANTYRLNVVDESSATPVELTPNAATSLGYIEFIADSDTVTLQILLAAATNVTGAQPIVENVAFHTIRLYELATTAAVRLRETVYESNLANHFDLACNSVGASWYVAADGITRFHLPGASRPLVAVFTDDDTPDALHYVDITAARDTRGMFNRLEVTNYGIIIEDDERREQNDQLVVLAPASVEAYGTRTAQLFTNLYGEPPYDETLNNRLDALLDENSAPRYLIASIRWNAQEDLALASRLEIGDRIIVRHRGVEQSSHILHISHEITPTRWMINLALSRPTQ